MISKFDEKKVLLSKEEESTKKERSGTAPHFVIWIQENPQRHQQSRIIIDVQFSSPRLKSVDRGHTQKGTSLARSKRAAEGDEVLS